MLNTRLNIPKNNKRTQTFSKPDATYIAPKIGGIIDKVIFIVEIIIPNPNPSYSGLTVYDISEPEVRL